MNSDSCNSVFGFFPSSLARQVRHAGPGEPAARQQSVGALRRHGGVGVLHAARGHQPQHGERQSFSRQRRHREAGGHQQGTGERVGAHGHLFMTQSSCCWWHCRDGGTHRYSVKVVKAAAQVLNTLWQYRELRTLYKQVRTCWFQDLEPSSWLHNVPTCVCVCVCRTAGTTPTSSPPSPLWSETGTSPSPRCPPAPCGRRPSWSQVSGPARAGRGWLRRTAASLSGGSATSSPAMLGFRRHSSNYQRAQSSMQLDTFYQDSSLHKPTLTGLFPGNPAQKASGPSSLPSQGPRRNLRTSSERTRRSQERT